MRKRKVPATRQLVGVVHIANEVYVLHATPEGVVSLPAAAIESAHAYLSAHARYERAPRRVCAECQFESVLLVGAAESHTQGCSRAPEKS